MSELHQLRMIGSAGTNKVMSGEVSRLSKRALSRFAPNPRKLGSGILVYPFDTALASLIINYHRTSTRLLWDLFSSRAARLEPLYDELVRDVAADRRGWLFDGATISVIARNVDNFAAGARQIVGTVKNALIEGASRRGVSLTVDVDDPDILFSVRMQDDEVSVSIDLAGQSLAFHGYRQQRGGAPLREHLAAVLIMLARFDVRSEMLLDPMAGSGTIAIEAALMARGAPRWPEHQRPTLSRLPAFADVQPVVGELFADAAPAVVANEIDGPTVRAARANIRAAGVGEQVALSCADFRDLDRTRVFELARRADLNGDRGVMVCNPPYGERSAAPGGDDYLLDLYADLGDWCQLFPGWRAAFLVANPEFESAFRRRPRVVKPLSNGPLRASFYLYDL